MKKLIKFILLLIVFQVQGINAADNAIKMAYNFTTVSQTVVFNSTMQAGGTLQLSAQIADGGGRNPGDPVTLKLVFYNSSNAVITTVQQAYTLVLGAAASTYSLSTTNCGGSCSNVAYVSVEFYGKDGGYWAGNYGPYIQSPSLTFNGGSNILYNSQFGTYSGNTFAQGWSSSAGWQNCALYSGSATCVIDNGASVNGGNYSASGGTTSGTSGGYSATPTYTSGITALQQTTKNSALTRKSGYDHNGIYIDQVGNNNTINVTQDSSNNQLRGIGQQSSIMQGNYNNVTVRQGNSTGSTSGKNLLELKVVGDSNTLNLNQGVNQFGTADATDSNNHYQMLNLMGSNNNIITVQKDTSAGSGHFMETTISGNSNVLDLKQSNAGPKTMFTNVNGNSNTINATQSGNADHYLETMLTGNGNSITAVQSGNTQNRASISITNAGGPGSVDLQQTGGQVYNISTSCVTAGGCAPVVVRQGN